MGNLVLTLWLDFVKFLIHLCKRGWFSGCVHDRNNHPPTNQNQDLPENNETYYISGSTASAVL